MNVPCVANSKWRECDSFVSEFCRYGMKDGSTVVEGQGYTPDKQCRVAGAIVAGATQDDPEVDR